MIALGPTAGGQPHNRNLRLRRFILVSLGLFLCNQIAVAQESPRFEISSSTETGQATHAWHFSSFRDASQPVFVAVQAQQLWLHGDGINRTLQVGDEYLETVFSKKGTYFGIVSRQEIPDSEHSNLLLEVFSAAGDPRYSLTRFQARDDTRPNFTISDLNGVTVVAQNTTGMLEFYNESGLLKKQIELFKQSNYDLERVVMLDPSWHGEVAVIVSDAETASGEVSQSPNRNAWLLSFDPDGHERWRKPMPGFGASVVAISPDSRYIFSNAYTVDAIGRVTKASFLFDRDGKRRAQFDFLCKRVTFSHDSERAILSDNREALLVDLSLRQIAGKYGLTDPQAMIITTAIADNGIVAAVLSARLSYDNGFFYFSEAPIADTQ